MKEYRKSHEDKTYKYRVSYCYTLKGDERIIVSIMYVEPDKKLNTPEAIDEVEEFIVNTLNHSDKIKGSVVDDIMILGVTRMK